MSDGSCGSCEPNAPRCEGCDCCAECCNCTATDCDCDECIERRANEDKVMVDTPRMELEFLALGMADIHGFIPDPMMIGAMLTHTAREDQFIVTDIVWIGATDEWGFEHIKMGEFGPKIVRPLKDLNGFRHTGEPRYQEINEYNHYHVDD